eukprot:4453803-Amphidinium_carterae.2
MCQAVRATPTVLFVASFHLANEVHLLNALSQRATAAPNMFFLFVSMLDIKVWELCFTVEARFVGIRSKDVLEQALAPPGSAIHGRQDGTLSASVDDYRRRGAKLLNFTLAHCVQRAARIKVCAWLLSGPLSSPCESPSHLAVMYLSRRELNNCEQPLVLCNSDKSQISRPPPNSNYALGCAQVAHNR